VILIEVFIARLPALLDLMAFECFHRSSFDYSEEFPVELYSYNRRVQRIGHPPGCSSPKSHPVEKLNRSRDVLTVRSRLNRSIHASWKVMKINVGVILARDNPDA
jgi:hypothetical protein